MGWTTPTTVSGVCVAFLGRQYTSLLGEWVVPLCLSLVDELGWVEEGRGYFLSPMAGLHSPLQTPGLLMGAQAAHCAVPGTTAYTGIWGWEATHSTEGALGPGWGTCTGCQVVGALRCTQVLQGHEGTGILNSPVCHAADVHQGC